MRICPSCGRQNADDVDFCACGEYIRWEPTAFVRAVPAPAEAEPEAEDGPPAAEPVHGATVAPGAAAPPPASRAAAPPSAAGPPPPAQQPVVGGMAPDAATLSLRLPDGEYAGDGAPVTASLEPGGRASVRALVRNQSTIVDNYDVSVVGLPDGWWSVSPPTLYLVPMGAGGTYEQEVDVRIHPPRTAEAEARVWPFDIVITSRANGGAQAAAAPANADIAPYLDVRTDLSPDRRKGRRRAQFTLGAENRANAPVMLEFGAADADGECKFHFAQRALSVAPAERVEVPLVIRPPKMMWIGRPQDRQFEATVAAPGHELALLPQHGVYRQRPWFPIWLITLLPLLIIAAVLILLLMPKKVVVPDLTKAASRFAVEQQLQKAGLNPVPQVEKVTTGGKPGQIIAQSPAAGKKVSKNTLVTIQVVVGTGLVTAPNVVGMKVKDAAGALDAVGLKLGEMLPPPPDPDATIGSQIPPAGKQVHPGDAIAVFVVHAKGGAGKAAAGGAAAGGAAAGGAAGAGGANAAGGKPAPVPAVAGKSVADAAAALAAAGMLPVTVQRYDASKPGTLVRTVPAAGAKVPPGTTVTLIVSAGFPQLVFDAPTGLMSVTGPAQPALLAGTQPGDGEATWSADGTHIAYVSGRDIVVAAPGKPGSVVLRGGGAAFRDPAFAPAGRVLAVTKRTNGDGDLCLATVSGATQADCISEPNIDVGRSVSWSHDGKEILVAGHPKGKPQNFGLVLYRSNVPFSPHAADWGKGVPVTDVSRTGVGALAGAFSPDGKQLAIGSNAGGGGFQLYITTPDDFKLGNAKSFAVAACAVAWRPDSQQLAVVTNPDCPSANNGQVVLVDPAHPQRLAPVAANGAHPAWQPLALTGG